MIHGYHSCYCHLHLYLLSGRHLLAALLRPSNIDASASANLRMVISIVDRIRGLPRVAILLRADSGFARDDLMAWCEATCVAYASA